MMNSSRTIYQRILSIFPRDNISLCFAYGSAVYPQKHNTNKNKKNVIDLVFVVPNSFLWHEENVKLNPKHYSSLRYLGTSNLSKIQEKYGAGVYYNTLIPHEDIMFKYGVVSESTLITDLLDWNYLYLAGRLHKPVDILQSIDNTELRGAIQTNLSNAIHASLLQLPETFNERDLYYTIAGISYNGDFRMIFGEDRNKINNIVDAQENLFRELYKPILKSLHDYIDITYSNGKCIQNYSSEAKMYHLNQLPRIPQQLIVRRWNKSSKRKLDTEDVLGAVAHNIDSDVIVSRVLYDIVWSSSISQAIKGIFTAGLFKSFHYSLAKIKKMMSSMKKTNNNTTSTS